LLDINAASINQIVEIYQPKRHLTFFKGEREVLPEAAFPSLEMEATSGSNQWGTTRAQRPTYNFNCVLTTATQNEKLHLEYNTTLATRLVEILTSPQNLQLRVLNETKWTMSQGLVDTYILDSLITDVTYNSAKEGTIRMAEFTWFATIHEPYPQSMWTNLGASPPTTPTILRPTIIAA